MIFLYSLALCWLLVIALDLGLKVSLPECILCNTLSPQTLLQGVYVRFLSRRGITLKPFQVNLQSTCTNHFWPKIGLKYPRLCDIWFKIGIFSCFILIPISMIILSHNLISYIAHSPTSSSAFNGQSLQPVVSVGKLSFNVSKLNLNSFFRSRELMFHSMMLVTIFYP